MSRTNVSSDSPNVFFNHIKIGVIFVDIIYEGDSWMIKDSSEELLPRGKVRFREKEDYPPET